jgi:hypothetical protein
MTRPSRSRVRLRRANRAAGAHLVLHEVAVGVAPGRLHPGRARADQPAGGIAPQLDRAQRRVLRGDHISTAVMDVPHLGCVRIPERGPLAVAVVRPSHREIATHALDEPALGVPPQPIAERARLVDRHDASERVVLDRRRLRAGGPEGRHAPRDIVGAADLPTRRVGALDEPPGEVVGGGRAASELVCHLHQTPDRVVAPGDGSAERIGDPRRPAAVVVDVARHAAVGIDRCDKTAAGVVLEPPRSRVSIGDPDDATGGVVLVARDALPRRRALHQPARSVVDPPLRLSRRQPRLDKRTIGVVAVFPAPACPVECVRRNGRRCRTPSPRCDPRARSRARRGRLACTPIA